MMLKNFLTFVLIGVVLFAMLPSDAFCADMDQPMGHHHGVVVCHLHVDISEPLLIAVVPKTGSSSLLNNHREVLLYQSPVLDGIFRPPIFFS